MRPRHAWTCALLVTSACALRQAGARLSETEALYRAAILQLAGSGAGPILYAPGRTLCIGIRDDRGEQHDPSAALLASVRSRLPRARSGTDCPRSFRETASLLDDPQWIVLGPLRRDASGIVSFGWNQPPGFGGSCTVQKQGTPAVACIGI
jgi:hypothetical protein